MTLVPAVGCVRNHSVSNPTPGMKWIAIAIYAICCFEPGLSYVFHSTLSRRSLTKLNALKPYNDGTSRSKLSTSPFIYKNSVDEALTKAMGMGFDSNRQRWVRGKVPTGAEITSYGGRRLDVVDVLGDDHVNPRPAVAAAAEHLQVVLRAAREETMKVQPSFVQRIALSRAGMYLWAICQALTMLLVARVMVSDELSSSVLEHNSMHTLIIGATAGIGAVLCDRKKWALQPGLEPKEGALERKLADAALGVIALPAPWDWRANCLFWKFGAFLFEGISAATSAALLHGVVQSHVILPWLNHMLDGPTNPLFVDSASFGQAFEAQSIAAIEGTSESHAAAASTIAVLALAALAAVATAAEGPCPEAKGMAAECTAVARARMTARAYFTGERLNRILNLRSASSQARVAVGTDAAEATQEIAKAWEKKFTVQNGRTTWERVWLTGLSTGVAAIAFEYSGGHLLAPVACATTVLFDRYLLRPHLSDHSRAKATLPLDSFSVVNAATSNFVGDDRAVALTDAT